MAARLTRNVADARRIDTLLLTTGIAVFGALLAGGLLLELAVGGRLPLALHLTSAASMAAFGAGILLVMRATTLQQVAALRYLNLGIGVMAPLAASYFLGGTAWVGPYLLFFGLLGSALVPDRRLAIAGSAVTVGGFSALVALEGAGAIPSYDPFAHTDAHHDGVYDVATALFAVGAAVLFTIVASLMGFFVRVQSSRLARATSQLEASKAELEQANARLEERVKEKTRELEARNRELSSIAAIGQAVNSSLEFEDIVVAFVREARRLLPFERATVAVYSPDGRQLRYVSARESEAGWTHGSREIDAETSVQMSSKPRIVDDFDALGEYSEKEAVRELGIRSGASIPLTSRGRLLGSFNIVSRESRRFDVSHLRLMERIAEPLALAIENARLYEEMRSLAEAS